MYSTNNSNLEQNYVYCRYGCGVRITFSDNAVSKNGRMIPLQENGQPHNCPKSYFNIRRQTVEENNNKFANEVMNPERHTSIDSQRGRQDSDQKQEQHSDNPTRKIIPEQQLYVDTIGSTIVEIHSLVHEIYKCIVQETRKNE